MGIKEILYDAPEVITGITTGILTGNWYNDELVESGALEEITRVGTGNLLPESPLEVAIVIGTFAAIGAGIVTNKVKNYLVRGRKPRSDGDKRWI